MVNSPKKPLEREPSAISRRDFIGVTIGAVAAGMAVGCGSSGGGQPNTAALAGTGGTGAGGTATGGAGDTAAGGTGTGGVAGTGGDSGTAGPPLVALVRGTDWVQATQDAIALVGGLPDLTGKTVMLRPNVCEPIADSTASPDVIHGVILAVKAKGATNIIVAEDGFNNGGDTLSAMQTLGITAVCIAEGATAMDLSKQTYTNRTNINANAYPNGVSFSDPVYDADYVIAIPKCKTHGAAKYTMALKLWYGNVPPSARSHSSTWAAPAELHLIKNADFVVLDATETMTTGGPTAGGTMVQSKIVVASKDAIAADLTGLLIEKYCGSTVISTVADAWNMAQIKRALALRIPGWLTESQQFPYAQQGVTEAAAIMGY